MVRSKNHCGNRAKQHSIREGLYGILPPILRLINHLVLNRLRKITCSVCGCLVHEAWSKLNRGVGVILGQDDSQIMALYCSS